MQLHGVGQIMNTDSLVDRPVRPASKPLYLRMKEDLVSRILRGDWRPGELVPSEVSLAQEYAVSVGTARKAIDELAAERLVVRSRGRGTTIASSNGRYEPFRFYRLMADDGSRASEVTTYVSIVAARANAAEARGLGIKRGAAVTRILRLRSHSGRPAVIERIVLGEERCPGAAGVIEKLKPPSIYSALERSFHILVCRTEEKIRSIPAAAEDAERLAITPGTPILEVERLAYDLSGAVVEYRIMRAAEGVHYAARSS